MFKLTRSCIYLKTATRNFSTTGTSYGKRNFRKFLLHNRGTRNFKAKQKVDPHPDCPVYDYGVKSPGYFDGRNFVTVPEMVPELIVPDLTDFHLKPYISYRVPDIVEDEFTPEKLFTHVYKDKIEQDFKEGNLDKDGSAKEPSPEEKLTPEEAKLKAKQTGCDIFCPRNKREEDELFDKII